MLVIQASNINSGGGAILLDHLLIEISRAFPKLRLQIFIDERFQYASYSHNFYFYKVRPTVLSRFIAEIKINKMLGLNPDSKVLCFGNLPLLFSFKKNSMLFFQNVLILDNENNKRFNLKTRFKFFLERIWIQIGLKNIKTVFVQTKTVRDLFLKSFPKSNIVVFPFCNLDVKLLEVEKINDFIYITSSEPHKNIENLILSWEILVQEGYRLKLILTAWPRNKVFKDKLNNLKGLITVMENLSRAALNLVLNESKALIYPSYCESFGLPLLEAKMLKLPVIASDLDYVFDVCSPAAVFNPKDPKSIAEAVKSFIENREVMSTKKTHSVKICTAAQFVDEILKQS